jgi:hypothetical protein
MPTISFTPTKIIASGKCPVCDKDVKELVMKALPEVETEIHKKQVPHKNQTIREVPLDHFLVCCEPCMSNLQALSKMSNLDPDLVSPVLCSFSKGNIGNYYCPNDPSMRSNAAFPPCPKCGEPYMPIR